MIKGVDIGYTVLNFDGYDIFIRGDSTTLRGIDMLEEKAKLEASEGNWEEVSRAETAMLYLKDKMTTEVSEEEYSTYQVWKSLYKGADND